MQYINIDERKEPTEMLWKQGRRERKKERKKKERKKERKPTIFSVLLKA